ncbi:MAG: YbjQ family protein [Candidatus Aenigmarchaeota archaeon]|nr:YbjQ family protein [Candidatus Aenigmarchaeota archaeon]
MITTTTDSIPEKQISEILGVVKGNTIRAKWFGKDIVSGLRQIVGGELKEYTEMLVEAREEALKRMEDQAVELKADAVINIRFSTSQVMKSAAEILVYGTAVKLR